MAAAAIVGFCAVCRTSSGLAQRDKGPEGTLKPFQPCCHLHLKMSPTINAYTASQVTEMVSRAGVHKGRMHPMKVFLSSVSAGCLLSFAAASCITANTSPWVCSLSREWWPEQC